MSMRLPASHPRRHGAVLEPDDRRRLERAGWRTTLDYRENHVRGRSGQLIEVVQVWTAEAERFDGILVVVNATAETAEAAWSLLRAETEAAPAVEATRRIRLVRERPPAAPRFARST